MTEQTWGTGSVFAEELVLRVNGHRVAAGVVEAAGGRKESEGCRYQVSAFWKGVGVKAVASLAG